MQHLLLVVIALVIAGLAYLLIKWPGGQHMTFSQHAATTCWSKVYYLALFLITLPLLMWFLIDWLAPNKGLSDSFLWFAGIAVFFQIACTWFPEEGSTKTKIHRLLTGISGVAMLPTVALIAMAPSIPSPTGVVAWSGLAIMTILLVVALTHQKGFRWALLLQIAYYAVFFVVLVVTTYA